jgi:hypothetical protein
MFLDHLLAPKLTAGGCVVDANAGEREGHTHLPNGTVTFLFTDIEGSTEPLERIRQDFGTVIAEHNALFPAAFAKWNGREL